MKIVFVSHTAQVGVFRVGSHHLSRELALAGHEVIHISTPITLAHLSRLRDGEVRARFKSALRGPTKDSSGVVHVLPIVALPTKNFSERLSRLLLSRPLRGWKKLVLTSKPVDVMFIDQPSLGLLIDLLKPQTVIYRPTDAHFDSHMRRAEKRILDRADAIVATSHVVHEEVTKEMSHRPPSLILENGVDFERFREEVGGPGSARVGVVYLGSLDKRFGWNALAAMAEAYPDLPFRIAGPLPTEPLRALPANIKLLGPVPYEQAPELLNSAQVGILPFSNDRGNEGRSPMKYFEYLAAGLSVVASASPTLAARSAPNVWLYGSPEEAVQALAFALRAPSPNLRGVDHAASFSWAARAKQLEFFAESVVQPRKVV